MLKIEKIAEMNAEAGRSFFEKRTISRFVKKVLPTVYGDKYFVTSDMVDLDGTGELVKRYTVREAVDGGRLIRHVGDYHAYVTKAAAVAEIQNLLGDTVPA